MEQLPLVSVGIPTYNRPQGLRRTLECITGQTYTNIEIIISNNCSPDEEVENVAKEFMKRDDRITYYKQKENILGKNFPFFLKKLQEFILCGLPMMMNGKESILRN